MTGTDETILDWRFAAADVATGGSEFVRQATDTERAAVAAALDLLACEKLDVRGRIKALAGGSYRFKGSLRAAVIQSCVVTLEPVAASIDEPVAVEFRRDVGATDDAADLDVEFDIEPIEHSELAIGRVAFETLAASLDPYPRAPGASFEAAESKPKSSEPEKVSPFAALAKLKPKT